MGASREDGKLGIGNLIRTHQHARG